MARSTGSLTIAFSATRRLPNASDRHRPSVSGSTSNDVRIPERGTFWIINGVEWFRACKRLDFGNDAGREVQADKHRLFANGLHNMIDVSAGKERRSLV